MRLSKNSTLRSVNVFSGYFNATAPRFYVETLYRLSGGANMSTQPQIGCPSQGPDYSTWSNSSLVSRIMELERQLNAQTKELRSVPDASASHSSPQTKSEVNDATTLSSEADGRSTLLVRPVKKPRDIDPSNYHTRHIALKLAYLGQRYNGFEHANGNVTPLPTIEEELWKALRKSRLIFPTTSYLPDFNFDRSGPNEGQAFELNWDNCQYSKCGRTDRGVSGFGQVISLRVRSARPKRKSKISAENPPVEAVASDGGAEIIDSKQEKAQVQAVYDSESDDGWDDIQDELPYVQILNNVLPDDIRILAWCPHLPPDFDARFSCRERQYRYFFTQPAFTPTHGELGFTRGAAHERGIAKKKLREGWLDIEAMREACKHFEGTHDFRNFCRVDTSKQITNFERIIYHASIDLVDPRQTPLGYVGSSEYGPSRDVDGNATAAETGVNEDKPSTPLVYTFTLHGSAFLWHQVRHMVSILFLVGQGIESPSIVPELLDVAKNPCKPMYEMASDAPLVLWDCIFPDLKSGSREDALDWVYCGDTRQKPPSSKGDSKYGTTQLIDTLWRTWRQRKMDEILAGSLLDLAASHGRPSPSQIKAPGKPKSHKIFYGGDEAKPGGLYLPVMQKSKMDTVEVQNARYVASRTRRGKAVKGKSCNHTENTT